MRNREKENKEGPSTKETENVARARHGSTATHDVTQRLLELERRGPPLQKIDLKVNQLDK